MLTTLALLFVSAAPIQPCALRLAGLSVRPVGNASTPAKHDVFYVGEPVTAYLSLLFHQQREALPGTVELEVRSAEGGTRRVRVHPRFGAAARDPDGFWFATAEIDLAPLLSRGTSTVSAHSPLICPEHTMVAATVRYLLADTIEDQGFKELHLAIVQSNLNDAAAARAAVDRARRLIGRHDEVVFVEALLAGREGRPNDACRFAKELYLRTQKSVWREASAGCRDPVVPNDPHGSPTSKTAPRACLDISASALGGSLPQREHEQKRTKRYVNEIRSCFSTAECTPASCQGFEFVLHIRNDTQVASVERVTRGPSPAANKSMFVECVAERAQNWLLPKGQPDRLTARIRLGADCVEEVDGGK